MERVGHTWLPMGRPSGVAESFEALAARKPAAPETITAFSINFRLDIGVICIWRVCCGEKTIRHCARQSRRWIAVQSNLALDFPAYWQRIGRPSEFLMKLAEMSAPDNRQRCA